MNPEKLKLSFCLVVLFSLISIKSWSQDRRVETLSYHKQYRVAAELIKSAGYYKAIEYLLQVVKKDSTNREYKYLLAEAYFLARDYKNGEKWFEQVVKMDGKNTTEAQFRYAECLKYNGKYELAKIHFETFVKSKYKEKKGDKFKTFAKNEVGSCDFAIKNKSSAVSAEITHLGDNINSAYTEFSPRPVNDSTLVFASLQADSVLNVEYGEIHYYHVKLYSSENQQGEWNAPEELKELNSDFENTANGVYNADKTKFYFTRCHAVENKVVCEIFVSELKDGVFQKPAKLKNDINKAGFTTTMPTIVNYTKGKTKTEGLIFASDRPGGRGGMDLWYALMDPKTGNFKKPVNMGQLVNTARDEISPFYDNKTNTLYFSSNFHFGFGGYDIFRSSGDLGKSVKPENMGMPINSSVDDTYYNLIENKTEGFLVSNRPGGTHLTSETCCDDIYSLRYIKPHVIALEVLDKTTGKDVLDAQVLLIAKREVGQSTYDTIQPIDKKMELNIAGYKEQNHYYNLEKNTEYAVKAFNKYDTMVFVFETDAFGSIRTIEHDTVHTIYEEHKSLVTADALLADLYLRIPDTTQLVAKKEEVKKEEVKVEEKKIVPADTAIALNKKVEETDTNLNLNKKVVKKEEETKVERNKKVMEEETSMSFTQKIVSVDTLKVVRYIETKKKVEFSVIINYDFDDTKFIEKNHGSLDTLAAFMKEYADVKIEIDSHTDNKGSDAYNLALSQRRSRSIEIYLLGKGIPKSRMVSVGYGETKPILPNENPDGTDNPENRHQNRRTEIKIIADDKIIEKAKMLKHN
ncbi:MAG: OmpA family protein [Cytophagaceae bacterium]|nr:OmpA family protein [Cytophagaceae bacterium]